MEAFRLAEDIVEEVKNILSEQDFQTLSYELYRRHHLKDVTELVKDVLCWDERDTDDEDSSTYGWTEDDLVDLVDRVWLKTSLGFDSDLFFCEVENCVEIVNEIRARG